VTCLIQRNCDAGQNRAELSKPWRRLQAVGKVTPQLQPKAKGWSAQATRCGIAAHLLPLSTLPGAIAAVRVLNLGDGPGDVLTWPLFVLNTSVNKLSEIRMKLGTLHDLYVDELKDLYNAEHQLLKALPKMAKAATAPKLAKAFTDHLEETKVQIERLEKIFKKLDASPKGKTCKAMEGLIEEGKEVMDEDAEPAVMDAALIAAGQRVEHYEMAGYGCVRTFATLLGYKDAADLLQQTLDEEGAADKKLTKLAETVINVEATAPAGSE
jgi:ferritin-like metal-binding protein YciE